MKKKLALIMAIITALGCSVTANAKTVNLSPKSDTIKIEKRAGSPIEIQNEVSHGEGSAIHIYNTIGSKTWDMRVNITAGDTVTFWEKGMVASAYNDMIRIDTVRTAPEPYTQKDGEDQYMSTNGLGIYAYLAYMNKPEYTLNENTFPATIVEEGEDGWRKWKISPYVFEKSGSVYLVLIGEHATNPNGWYLDDVVCTAADGSEKFNLDFNGGAYDKAAAESNYLKGLSANGADGKITLSWRNPKMGAESIKVIYRGEDITCEANLNKEAFALNSFVIDGLTNDKKYTYSVISTIDGVEYENIITGVAGRWSEDDDCTAEGVTLGGWKIKTEGEALGSVHYDNISRLDGKQALFVNTNSENSDAKIILEMDSSGIEVGKTYKITYNSRKTMSGTPTDIWTAEEEIFTATEEDKSISFAVKTGNDGIWLDKVKVEEYDLEKGEVIGEDVAVNGSFEKMPEFESKLMLYKGDAIVSDLSSGTHSIEAELTNKRETERVQAALYAVLKKDNALVEAWESRAVRIDAGESATLRIENIEIPELEEAGNYELYVFIWDSLLGMVSHVPMESYV